MIPPIDSEQTTSYSPAKEFILLMLKATALSFVFVTIFLAITAAVAGIWINNRISSFEKQAGVSRTYLWQNVQDGLAAEVPQTNGHYNMLILGLDSLENRGSVPPLSDTMIIASLNLNSGTVRLLPLPRDLWSNNYQTKINSLYSYGMERYPEQPERFPTEVLQEMTGITIHKTIPLTLDTLGTVIDTVGGIEVEVKDGFVDTEFPRSDVDIIVERDPAKLYMRVEFKPGVEKMTGERALQFIRSRHSMDEEGSDIARSQRQQLVISALLTRLRQKEVITSPQYLAQLYQVYVDNFQKYISLPELVSLAKAIYPYRESIVLEDQGIGISPDEAAGSITHPPLSRLHGNQWVYTVVSDEAFKNEVQSDLGLR